MAPTGERTQSEAEILDLLLATHFPYSVMVERGVTPAAACRTTHADRRVAAKIITHCRVEWAIDFFTPYKSPGMDEIFPTLLQEGPGSLFPTSSRYFIPAWRLDTFQLHGAR